MEETITVNGVLIPDNEVMKESAHHDDEPGIDAKHQAAAKTLVIREVLRQRVKELDIDTSDTLETAIDELLEREVNVPEPDKDTCRNYYEQNPERFRTPAIAEVRHILLAAAPDDVEARQLADKTAKVLVRKLKGNPAAFEKLARDNSACPSADDGGHLGQVTRGQTVPEFEDVVLRLEPGLAARPIETRYGFHVVEVLSRADGRQLPFEDVRNMIAEYLTERSWRRAVSQYIGLLLTDADITGVNIDSPESPLVQ